MQLHTSGHFVLDRAHVEAQLAVAKVQEPLVRQLSMDTCNMCMGCMAMHGISAGTCNSACICLYSSCRYIYLLLAFLDVEANFLVTKAYQYTSITSVTLLDCFTIPAVMVLSWVSGG